MDLRTIVGHRPLFMPGAAVLIFDEDRRLLLQHRADNGLWGLIGGSLELDETMEEAARREAFEESGLILGDLEWFGLFTGPDQRYEYPNGDVTVNVAAVYVARQYSGELRIDGEESLDLRFFDLDSLPQDISPPDVPILARCRAVFGGLTHSGA